MDVRTGLIVLICVMGFTCAEPVKYLDCGEFVQFAFSALANDAS